MKFEIPRTRNLWPVASRWFLALARGMALFLGVFSLVNLVSQWRSPGFDANLWWIDLRGLPTGMGAALLTVSAVLLVAFSLKPVMGTLRRCATASSAGLLAAVAMKNATVFYELVAREVIQSSFPLPLSLLVALACTVIIAGIFQSRGNEVRRFGFAELAAFGICCVGFPVAQMACFGTTSYQRTADAAVVFGARAYASGRPSPALADRVRTACDLYRCGLVRKLVFSGGPGDGDIHETESMRRFAMSLGVRAEDILKDEHGLNTRATAQNTQPMFSQLRAHRVIAVSHFYHLPRIKMAYQREGVEVFTVPANQQQFLRHTPYVMAREVAAWWVYYARAVQG